MRARMDNFKIVGVMLCVQEHDGSRTWIYSDKVVQARVGSELLGDPYRHTVRWSLEATCADMQFANSAAEAAQVFRPKPLPERRLLEDSKHSE